MKKKTVFDKQLYKEGMRLLMPFGFLMFGLLMVFSLLYSASTRMEASGSTLKELFDALSGQYAFLYILIIVLVVPILTLKMFYFLTTRNGSDFFHAIPHKKQCIHLSFAAAIFTWVFICTAAPATTSYVLLALLGVNVMSCSMFLLAVAHILVAALLVMSTICIACAITGTILTNILTTGIILFFPRLFLYGFRLLLSGITNGFLVGNSFFFGTRCNLVVQSILALLNDNYYLFNIAPLIYTLVLSILYLVLATFLFERRHSETAMKPALSKRLQGVFCLLLGSIASMIPIAILTDAIWGTDEFESVLIFGVGILYLLITVAMGIYELITTMRIRNLITLLPRTGILALINVLLLLGLAGGRKLVCSYTPDASSITSVSFAFSDTYSMEVLNNNPGYNVLFNTDGDADSYCSRTEESYFTTQSSAYHTSNETVKDIVANAIKTTADSSETLRYMNSMNRLLVTVTTKYRTVTRFIYLPEKDYETLKDIVTKDDDFASIYTKLPEVNKKNLSIYNESSLELTKDELAGLYECIKEELSSMGDGTWQMALTNNNWNELNTLSFAVNWNSRYTSSRIPITSSLPKSYQKYMDLVNAKEKGKLTQFIKQSPSMVTDGSFYNFNFDVIDPSANYSSENSAYINSDQMTNASVTAFLAELSTVEDAPVTMTDTNKYIIKLNLDSYNQTEESDLSITKFISIDKATLDQIAAPLYDLDPSEG